MKYVTKLMVNEFKIKELGHDFMGYRVTRKSPLSFHHTIISHKKCLEDGLGHGYWKWNGSILVQDTSHEYIHVIERIDPDAFYAVSSELIDMNVKGCLDVENLRNIDDILKCFEKEHCSDRNKKGRVLIKDQYLDRFHF